MKLNLFPPHPSPPPFFFSCSEFIGLLIFPLCSFFAAVAAAVIVLECGAAEIIQFCAQFSAFEYSSAVLVLFFVLAFEERVEKWISRAVHFKMNL
jgi:hypothetical protein